jgi:hypothetical protein
MDFGKLSAEKTIGCREIKLAAGHLASKSRLSGGRQCCNDFCPPQTPLAAAVFDQPKDPVAFRTRSGSVGAQRPVAGLGQIRR